MWRVSKRSAFAALAAVLALTAPAAAQTPPAPRAPASRLPAAEMAVSPAAGLRPEGQAPAADTSRGRLSAPQMAGRPRAPEAARTDDSLVKSIEQRLRCTCGCNLDVFTCRTTDFTCATSPAMHRVVLARLDSGMTAAQVIAAFQQQYGEVVMMAPPKHGFNWAAYLMPFVGLFIGLGVVAAVMRGWFRVRPRQPLEGEAPAEAGAAPTASDDEMLRLERELERFEA
jgi:cytochrome c-type biogenesis protein CcmH